MPPRKKTPTTKTKEVRATLSKPTTPLSPEPVQHPIPHKHISHEMLIIASAVLLLAGVSALITTSFTQAAPQRKPTFEKYSACIDSDNGDTIQAKGLVSYKNRQSFADYCVSNTVVREYTCKSEQIVRVDHTCPETFECNDGRCVEILSNSSSTDTGILSSATLKPEASFPPARKIRVEEAEDKERHAREDTPSATTSERTREQF